MVQWSDSHSIYAAIVELSLRSVWHGWEIRCWHPLSTMWCNFQSMKSMNLIGPGNILPWQQLNVKPIVNGKPDTMLPFWVGKNCILWSISTAEHFVSSFLMCTRTFLARMLTEANRLPHGTHQWLSALTECFAVLMLHWQWCFLPLKIGGVILEYPSTVRFMSELLHVTKVLVFSRFRSP